MKKLNFPARKVYYIYALVCIFAYTSCGDGGGTAKSNLNKNEYLGNLPAIYDNYILTKAAMEKKLEEEIERLVAGGEKNESKIDKLFNQGTIKEKELKEKFDADVKAEIATLTGKEIPVTFSEKLKNSEKFYYNVTNVKLVEDKGDPKISITITAKDDFSVPSMKAYDYTAYYRLMGSNGPLLNSISSITPIPLVREVQSFKKDFLFKQALGQLALGYYSADRATFTGIEFISKDEYNKANGL